MNRDGVDVGARPISVECDWCGQKLTGHVRREHVGRMIVVQALHRDAGGRDCLGSGRAIGTWPLRVELRAIDGAFDLRIGGGRPRPCPTRDALTQTLRELGIESDEALVWADAVLPGRPVTLEVAERRKSARPRPD